MQSLTSQILSSLHDRSIGFEYVINRLYEVPAVSKFPPYNVYSKDSKHYVEMALSGYSRSDLKVYTENGDLVVEATKSDSDKDVKFIHNGLARRSFKWTRAISDDIIVRTVNFKDGLLTIELERVVPDAHVRRDYL
jgi:HSP20 family molecular chaperone IbpA